MSLNVGITYNKRNCHSKCCINDSGSILRGSNLDLSLSWWVLYIVLQNSIAWKQTCLNRHGRRRHVGLSKLRHDIPQLRSKTDVNSMWPSYAICQQIWVNIGSDNGLLRDDTNPLPEPTLTDHQWSPVTIIFGQFHRKCLSIQSLKYVRKLHAERFIQISHWPMS